MAVSPRTARVRAAAYLTSRSRCGWLTAAAAAASGLLVACGSSASSSSPAPAASPSTSQAQPATTAGPSSAAAGSTYYPLDFTNTSSAPCQMYGFPGVSFVTAATGTGQQIGAAALRGQAFAKVAVRLAPGGTAHAWLKVAAAGNYPASSCGPVTAHWLRIYPPARPRPVTSATPSTRAPRRAPRCSPSCPSGPGRGSPIACRKRPGTRRAYSTARTPLPGGSWCHADTGVSMTPLPYLPSHGGREFVSRCTHFLNRSVISGT